MRTPSVLLASFFFLLCAFATTAEFKSALDSDGDLMFSGGAYLIKPVRYNDLRGIFADVHNPNGESNECSLPVVAGFPNGWEIKISNFFSNFPFLLTNFPATISFNYVPPNNCTNSSNWVVQRSPSGKKAVVLPSSEDPRQSSIFEVVPYDMDESHTYQLVYCGRGKDDECENIGVERKNKNSPLIVADGEPLVVKFVKAFQNQPHLSMVV